MLALLLAAAQPQTVIDAERAFAADAQRIGQWAAFRKWAHPDATMFLPQPSRAQDWLKDRKEPAKAIAWWPTAAWVSCDGALAVDTGGSRRPDGGVGYFTTVWQRQPDGSWRWIVDGGDGLASARPQVAQPPLTRATCAKLAPAVSSAPTAGAKSGQGHSADWTLLWRYEVDPDGGRTFVASLYDGSGYREVVRDRIAAPKP